VSTYEQIAELAAKLRAVPPGSGTPGYFYSPDFDALARVAIDHCAEQPAVGGLSDEEVFELAHEPGVSDFPGDPPLRDGYDEIAEVADAALAAAPAPAGGLLELLAEAENRRLKVLQERDDGIAHAGIARGRLDELDWLLKQLPSVCRQGRVYEPGRRG
jgi:hypothetical protein